MRTSQIPGNPLPVGVLIGVYVKLPTAFLFPIIQTDFSNLFTIHMRQALEKEGQLLFVDDVFYNNGFKVFQDEIYGFAYAVNLRGLLVVEQALMKLNWLGGAHIAWLDIDEQIMRDHHPKNSATPFMTHVEASRYWESRYQAVAKYLDILSTETLKIQPPGIGQ